MNEQSTIVAPKEIQHWPTWALALREDFVKEAFKLESPWEVTTKDTIKDSVDVATEYVRTLYPYLDKDYETDT